MKQKRLIFIFVGLVGALAICAAFVHLMSKQIPTPASSSPQAPISETQSNAVRVDNDTQVIRIQARGGYTPKTIQAKAGIPTKLEVETKGTYDCSSAITIPELNYQTNLPATGITTIDLGSQKSGSTIRGICSMGMYSFSIDFE